MASPDFDRTTFSAAAHLAPKNAAHFLTVVEGVEPERSVRLGAEALILGREGSRPFHLPDPEISRSHCELKLVGESLRVRDLGSTNGTYIDGERVEGERELPVASLLQIGKHTLRHELLSPEEVARHEQLSGELERARRYIEDLIPLPWSDGPVRVDWCLVPTARLGGDCLGYHALADGRIAIYLLDVCGHGVGSALHSASALNMLRRSTLPACDFGAPEIVLQRLNETFAMEDHGGMYFTLWYGVLDPRSGELRYSSAGHPPALVLEPSGAIVARLRCPNPPIGVLAGKRFTAAATQLERGQRLFVFSDGVYELGAAGSGGDGIAALEALLSSLGDSPLAEPRRLYDRARVAVGGELGDDYTLLVLSRERT
ncbi:MAG: SpoIIE family protein phosphatase [Planctomycetes bacterium]|nr:SpoIIE family protein phosphatase [Planctomycetota bacterium]